MSNTPSCVPETHLIPAPNCYVQIPSMLLISNPSLLSRLYETYSSQSLLGLCISNASRDKIATITGYSAHGGSVEDPDTGEQHIINVFTSTEGHPCVDISKSAGGYPNKELLKALALSSCRLIISLCVQSDMTLCIVEKPAIAFPPMSGMPSFKPLASDLCSQLGNIPTPDEWANVWRIWDLVTLEMIPRNMLLQKPIDLRHKCLFYIGHIPTFLDMLMYKAIGGSATEPAYFWKIFERGIDPHVDDPEHCHNHSDVPEKDEDWPSLETIISFRDRVRSNLLQLYDDVETGTRVLTRNIARTLVMTLEHEAWHVETLLYMLVQRAGSGTLPPPGFTTPPWNALACQWNTTPAPSTETVTLGPTILAIGHDDSEANDADPNLDIYNHEYGWDNESPARLVEVGAFKAEWRPVSNGEFEKFWKGDGKGSIEMPKSWVEENGQIEVLTLYGPVSMNIAQSWPVLTSYDDLNTYAHSKGGRLPTEPELRFFLDTYEVGYEGGGNVGFRNWHPVAPTAGMALVGGRGTNGGVWEWTSTVFDNHDGLVPTTLFTGYSADFFDTKHQVVLGSSYATIPRLERRTARNFYQHNYPYPWVGARVVYDV